MVPAWKLEEALQAMVAHQGEFQSECVTSLSEYVTFKLHIPV
ncbi:protein of unknown function [Methylocaldum szegediense]|uniref:Uncharacterized protein n=1 Tax=Methylocaldum szegediense TaxID=73780 RepID=A0ABN8XCP1_9GAMM|nr:protein of unknown function [Methylocaldum szegediense]